MAEDHSPQATATGCAERTSTHCDAATGARQNPDRRGDVSPRAPAGTLATLTVIAPATASARRPSTLATPDPQQCVASSSVLRRIAGSRRVGLLALHSCTLAGPRHKRRWRHHDPNDSRPRPTAHGPRPQTTRGPRLEVLSIRATTIREPERRERSSGAGLTAAAKLNGFTRVALCKPPFIVDNIPRRHLRRRHRRPHRPPQPHRRPRGATFARCRQRQHRRPIPTRWATSRKSPCPQVARQAVSERR
jgi:hypothetical protein